MIVVDTIKSTGDIDRVFQSGKRVGNRLFLLVVTETPNGRDPMGRVAVVAGKKLGSAPFRNRCKRVLRETLRRNSSSWAGVDVVIVARMGCAKASPEELDRSLVRAIESAGLVS